MHIRLETNIIHYYVEQKHSTVAVTDKYFLPNYMELVDKKLLFRPPPHTHFILL